jgi:hypothetical protein
MEDRQSGEKGASSEENRARRTQRTYISRVEYAALFPGEKDRASNMEKCVKATMLVGLSSVEEKAGVDSLLSGRL